MVCVLESALRGLGLKPDLVMYCVFGPSTVTLSTQEYNFCSCKLLGKPEEMLGGNLASHSGRGGGRLYSLLFHAMEAGISFG